MNIMNFNPTPLESEHVLPLYIYRACAVTARKVTPSTTFQERGGGEESLYSTSQFLGSNPLGKVYCYL